MSKRFNHSIIRIKNSEGKYDSLTALRGQNSYELAVKAGFTGTEEEWMNSIIGDGWIGAFQTLETEQTTIKNEQTTIKAEQTTIKEKQTEMETSISNLEDDVDGITPASINAASLDSNGKVTASEASSRIITVTASTTLALTHAGTFIQANSTSAITITIPTNASVAFPAGTEIEICRWNTGAVTVAAASGVTLVSLDSSKTVAGRYGVVVLKKIATNTWLLAGALA